MTSRSFISPQPPHPSTGSRIIFGLPKPRFGRWAYKRIVWKNASAFEGNASNIEALGCLRSDWTETHHLLVVWYQLLPNNPLITEMEVTVPLIRSLKTPKGVTQKNLVVVIFCMLVWQPSALQSYRVMSFGILVWYVYRPFRPTPGIKWRSPHRVFSASLGWMISRAESVRKFRKTKNFKWKVEGHVDHFATSYKTKDIYMYGNKLVWGASVYFRHPVFSQIMIGMFNHLRNAW